MEGAPAAKRPRRPNFSDEEVMAMVLAVSEKKDILIHGCFDHSGQGSRLKQQAWQHVVNSVNAVSRFVRDIEDVRSKFKHFKSEVKKKSGREKQYQRGTGGGPAKPVVYTPAEEVVLQLIPEEVHGLNTGFPNADERALGQESGGVAPRPAGSLGVSEQLTQQTGSDQSAGPARSLVVGEGSSGPAPGPSSPTPLVTLFTPEDYHDSPMAMVGSDEEEWQQVQPEVLAAAADNEMALTDHSYSSACGRPAPSTDPPQVGTSSTGTLPGSQPGSRPGSQPGSRPGSQPGSRPGSQPGSRPGSQPSSRPTSRSGSRQPRHRASADDLTQMLRVQIDVKNEIANLSRNVERGNDLLEQGIAALERGLRLIAAALCPAGEGNQV